MKHEGFTLIEGLVVVIIIGLLAILFIPSMKDPIERGRAKNAEFNLLAIYSAEKRYLLNEKEYYLSNDTDSISRNLSIKIDDRYFTYNITAAGAGYVAAARRTDGQCRGVNMTVTHDNSTVNKTGCTAW